LLTSRRQIFWITQYIRIKGENFCRNYVYIGYKFWRWFNFSMTVPRITSRRCGLLTFNKNLLTSRQQIFWITQNIRIKGENFCRKYMYIGLKVWQWFNFSMIMPRITSRRCDFLSYYQKLYGKRFPVCIKNKMWKFFLKSAIG